MEIQIKLTPDQEAFVREGVASGRFESAEAAMTAAVQRWEEYERRRAELIAELDVGDAGPWIDISTPEARNALFDRIKRNARAEYEAKHGTLA